MKIDINLIQKDFILKAIYELTTLYDFENTTEKEFKETYGFSKLAIQTAVNQLKEEILSPGY